MRLVTSIIYSSFLIPTILSCSAQTDEAINGKWYFESLRHAESDEPMTKKLMHILVGDSSYRYLFPNNYYTEHTNGQTSHGRWKVVDDGGKLVMTSFDGSITSFGIAKITNDTLVLLTRKNLFVTFVKDANASETYVEEPSSNSVPVEATTAQISKRWAVKDIRLVSEATKDEERASEIMGRAVMGSWYDFKSNGLALMRFMNLKKAEWHFENGNKAIVIMEGDGGGSVFNIMSISDSELVLQKPQANNQLVFSAQKPIPLEGKSDPLLMALDAPRTVYSRTDVAPQFPGGDAGMRQWIEKNRKTLRTDQTASGTVNIFALIDITGELMKPKVVHSLGKEQDSEAIRLVKLMPFWKPGYVEGRPVIAEVIIKISLDD